MTQRRLPKIDQDHRQCNYCGKHSHTKTMVYLARQWFCNSVHFRLWSQQK